MPLEALYFGDLVIADAEEPYNDTVDSAAVKCNRRQMRNATGDIERCLAPDVLRTQSLTSVHL